MIDFQKTKSCFINIITLLIAIGNDINFDIDPSNQTLKRLFTASIYEEFNKHIALLKAILGIIERNKMKCVLFGKTSNGKSAVINALLGEKILPSSMGRTTACFVSVRGCDEDEGYLEIDNNNNKKQNLNLLNDLANQLSENKCDINSMLKVYWPKSRCRLLEYDLEILDSPGVDYKGEHDDWITRYCEDADVFILVVDGCRTLEASDKLFFQRITEKISKPNILVIVNKWDLVEQDVNVELIKKQIFDDVSQFLRDELKLYDENSVSNRIHFVSSKKELENKGTESFKEFKECLEMEMSRNAVNTKFKPHVDNIRLIAFGIYEFVNRVLDGCKTRVNNAEQMRLIIHEYISYNVSEMIQETKMLINSNQTYLAHAIGKAISEKRGFGIDTITFLETDFIHQLSFIFSNNLRNLENRIIEEYAERSCTDANPDHMKMYFTGDNDLSCLHEKYKELLMISVHNSTSDIRNIYKGQEDDIEMLRSVVHVTREVLPKILFMVSMLVPILPLKIVFGAASILPGFIPNPSTEDIEKTILTEFTSFYNSMTDHFIELSKTEVTQRIERLLTEYLKHQDQLLQFFKCFEDFKDLIGVQISTFINEVQFS